MNLLDVIAVVVSVAALLSYLNHRFVKLPSAIGLMLIAMLISAVLAMAGELGFQALETAAEGFVASIDFNVTLMKGMLSFLLFAGALHVNLDDLAEQKWVVGILASVGTLGSQFVLGLRFAAPVVAAMMIGNAALGVTAKTVPQLNVLMMAFPLQIAIGLLTLALSLSLIAAFFGDWPEHFAELVSGVVERFVPAGGSS